MTNYAAGVGAERRAMRILVAAGFEVARSAGSRGVVDVFAWNQVQVRLIQVKRGGAYASATEREALTLLPAPRNATKEIWRFPLRCREPLVEVL